MEILNTSFLLDTCVLALLARGDAYGYELTQEVARVINISEGALYPALRRLQTAGYLATYDRAFSGRNRRYYQITKPGAAKFVENYRTWEETTQAIDQIMKGAISDE